VLPPSLCAKPPVAPAPLSPTLFAWHLPEDSEQEKRLERAPPLSGQSTLKGTGVSTAAHGQAKRRELEAKLFREEQKRQTEAILDQQQKIVGAPCSKAIDVLLLLPCHSSATALLASLFGSLICQFCGVQLEEKRLEMQMKDHKRKVLLNSD